MRERGGEREGGGDKGREAVSQGERERGKARKREGAKDRLAGREIEMETEMRERGRLINR